MARWMQIDPSPSGSAALPGSFGLGPSAGKVAATLRQQVSALRTTLPAIRLFSGGWQGNSAPEKVFPITATVEIGSSPHRWAWGTIRLAVER